MKKLKILKIFLGLTFLILFIYNWSVALENNYEADGDAWDYIHLGLSVAKTGKYGHFHASRENLLSDFKKDIVKEQNYNFLGYTAFRPPVWPVLIAGIFFFFGYNLSFLLIFKFILHLIGTFIFFKSLKLLKLQEVIIIIGVFLYGINPAWQLYSRVFLSEPITLFFITLWVYLLIRFLKDGYNFWPQAIVAGIIVLSHPYYIFLPFSIWLVLFMKNILNLKLFILSSFMCATIISFWIIRNFLIFETNEIVLTTSSGAVIAKGWNEEVPETHTNTKGDLADETLVLQDYEYDKNRKYNEVEKMVLYKNATIQFIKTTPEKILPIVGKKVASAFNPFPETSRPGILETGRWFFQFIALLSMLYILIFSRNNIVTSLALGLIISTLGITVITYSGFRFRMPQTGIELLLLVYAISVVLERKIPNLSRVC